MSLLLMLSMLATPLPAEDQPCAIVDGSDWAIVSDAPEGWTVACGDDAMAGTAITMWPSGETSDKATALIYVAAFDKKNDTLDSFVAKDLAEFKSENSDPAALVIDDQIDVSSSIRRVHIGSSTGGRDELIDYIEGPTAFFIVVLTADSEAATKRHRAAFDSYIDSFSPATVTRKTE
jgi:hypothetical protein